MPLIKAAGPCLTTMLGMSKGCILHHIASCWWLPNSFGHWEILDTSGTLRVGIGFLSVAEPHFRGPHLHDVIICGTHGPMAGCEVPWPFQCANAPTKKRNLKPSIVHWACSASEIQVFCQPTIVCCLNTLKLNCSSCWWVRVNSLSHPVIGQSLGILLLNMGEHQKHQPDYGFWMVLGDIPITAWWF